jgi:hypothetical protein
MSLIKRLRDNIDKAGAFIAANKEKLVMIGASVGASSQVILLSGDASNSSIATAIGIGLAGLGLVTLAETVKKNYSAIELNREGYGKESETSLFSFNRADPDASLERILERNHKMSFDDSNATPFS